MPTATAARAPQRTRSAPAGLRSRIRLADGRTFTGELPPERHRSLQIGLLHQDTEGLVELAAGVRRDGRLQITTRRRADHFIPGGGSRGDGWREPLLELAARHADRDEEVFLAPAARYMRRGDKHAVCASRWLWVDVDEPGQLHALWAFLAERPCHLLVDSGGSGGVHAYWKLTQPSPATRTVTRTGELVEPIERANLRIIRRLGVGEAGKPNVADPACAERSRVMRLAGTINGKTGAHARIIEADLQLPRYRVEQLVGDLADPRPNTPRRAGRQGQSGDPYKRISPPEYFEQLAGIVVPRDGLVSCPAFGHVDRNPSCSVGTSPDRGWCCHSGNCGARGAIYDLASVLLGGPWGQELRGEAFKRARLRRRHVRRADMSNQTKETETAAKRTDMSTRPNAAPRSKPALDVVELPVIRLEHRRRRLQGSAWAGAFPPAAAAMPIKRWRLTRAIAGAFLAGNVTLAVLHAGTAAFHIASLAVLLAVLLALIQAQDEIDRWWLGVRSARVARRWRPVTVFGVLADTRPGTRRGVVIRALGRVPDCEARRWHAQLTDINKRAAIGAEGNYRLVLRGAVRVSSDLLPRHRDELV